MITLFLSFSPEEWDGPRSLAEMVEAEDEAVLSRMPDYRINLVSPAEIQAQEFEKFHSSLGNVLEFIKYSSDQKKLMGWLFREKPGLVLGRREVDVLNACVSAGLVMKQDEEEVEVCKAIEDYKMEAVEKATREVTKEVTENMQLQGIRNLMRNLRLTARQAAEALEIPPQEMERLFEKL